VILLTPSVATGFQNSTLAWTGGVTATLTYTGTPVPVVGAPVTGTGIPLGTTISSVNTGAGTLVIDQNTSAASGSGCVAANPRFVAAVEGLRHNGVGFGSLSGGARGYTVPVNGQRSGELLTQMGVQTVGGQPQCVPACSVDSGFQGGMNIYTQIDNRSNQPSKAKLVVPRVRVLSF
jgi:hypothetical protein